MVASLAGTMLLILVQQHEAGFLYGGGNETIMMRCARRGMAGGKHVWVIDGAEGRRG